MTKIIYKVSFFTNWHTGSGLTSGAGSDMLVNKDENGLPYVPGKTLKGLLREAAESILKLDEDLIAKNFIGEVFGTKIDESNEDNFHLEAKSFFSSAKLTEKLSSKLNAQDELKKHLFTQLASTSIDENGQAKDHTLRQIEASVPLTLYASIEDFPDDETYIKNMGLCFKWVKRIGLNRSRGLGRCELSTYKIN